MVILGRAYIMFTIHGFCQFDPDIFLMSCKALHAPFLQYPCIENGLESGEVGLGPAAFDVDIPIDRRAEFLSKEGREDLENEFKLLFPCCVTKCHLARLAS